MADIDTLTDSLDRAPEDPLTAAADAVPRRRAEVLTLGDCWRCFMRRPSPPLLAGAIVAALAVRIALGHYDWRDAVVAAGVIGATPVVEWLIHVYLLHAKPIRWRGQRYDLIAAREHRAHHRAPTILKKVLIPTYAVLIFIVQIAVTVWLLSFPIHLVLGGDRLAHAATGLLVSYVILGAYEWCHFLIHTPDRPRGRYYRSIWRGHRLHHYKNEHYGSGSPRRSVIVYSERLGIRLTSRSRVPPDRSASRSPTGPEPAGNLSG